MKKEPLISIGILNCNGLERLKKIISSCLKKEYKKYEIFVMGSGIMWGGVMCSKNKNIAELVENEE